MMPEERLQYVMVRDELGTDLLTEVNVEPAQDVVAINDTLGVGLKVIDHIEHGQVGGACFEL